MSTRSRLEQRILELKECFSPPKHPTEGSWCGKPRSAARYQLSELSQNKGGAMIHARHCIVASFDLFRKGLASSSLAIMSSPPPKEKQKLSQKLTRWLKPREPVADASAASSHSTPVSSSPSLGLTHPAGYAMDTGSTNTPEVLGKHIGSTTIPPLCP